MTAAGGRLGHRFWLLFSAATLSSLGDGVRHVAFPLLAAGLTADPRAVALLYAAGFLPWPLFGLVGGAVVDRVDRRALIWRTELTRATVVSGLGAATLWHEPSIAVLAAVSFLLGTAQVLVDNAASATVPMLVPATALERANGWLQSAPRGAATLVGAPLGAALFAVHPAAPVTLDAVTFAAAGVLVFALPGAYAVRAGAAPTGLGEDIAEGLRWLWRHELLRTLCLLVCAMNATLSAAQAILVLYASQVLRVSGVGYGALFTVLAVGGVLGTVAAPAARRRTGLRPFVIGCAFGQATAMAAVGLTADLRVSLVAVTVIGATSAGWNVVTISVRQALVPARLLGRVTSSYRIVALSAIPVGAVLGGLVADVHGLHAPFLGGAVLLAAVTALCRSRLPLATPTDPEATRSENPASVRRHRIPAYW